MSHLNHSVKNNKNANLIPSLKKSYDALISGEDSLDDLLITIKRDKSVNESCGKKIRGSSFEGRINNLLSKSSGKRILTSDSSSEGPINNLLTKSSKKRILSSDSSSGEPIDIWKTISSRQKFMTSESSSSDMHINNLPTKVSNKSKKSLTSESTSEGSIDKLLIRITRNRSMSSGTSSLEIPLHNLPTKAFSKNMLTNNPTSELNIDIRSSQSSRNKIVIDKDSSKVILNNFPTSSSSQANSSVENIIGLATTTSWNKTGAQSQSDSIPTSKNSEELPKKNRFKGFAGDDNITFFHLKGQCLNNPTDTVNDTTPLNIGCINSAAVYTPNVLIRNSKIYKACPIKLSDNVGICLKSPRQDTGFIYKEVFRLKPKYHISLDVPFSLIVKVELEGDTTPLDDVELNLNARHLEVLTNLYQLYLRLPLDVKMENLSTLLVDEMLTLNFTLD